MTWARGLKRPRRNRRKLWQPASLSSFRREPFRRRTESRLRIDADSCDALFFSGQNRWQTAERTSARSKSFNVQFPKRPKLSRVESTLPAAILRKFDAHNAF